ncbi:AP-4 complex accessory subunit RUSC2 isoform X2 [Hippocampus zosterae]|uniref:AP-4 complex accessory subunit RUSC2 isoform X2 n=1 Tax=Hippocampus zosterae TaxID=109293 RepID=UPI00223D720E|nr:AP-4 complex accessory subunit RUSC2 isoform X2 [Hippocampus zosterae]
MDGHPKLSGETLIVHHIPLVHCQVSGRRQGLCGVGGGNPFSPPENLGLSRTTSLPERDILQREGLLYSSLVQSRARDGGPRRKGGGGGSTASDDSSFASSISDEQPMAAHTLPRVKTRSRHPLRRNPFLIKTDDDDDEYEDDEYDDDLSGYREDSSFHLHGRTDGAAPPLRPRDLDRNRATRDPDPPRRLGSGGSNMSVDGGEHDWEDDEDGDHPMPCGRGGETGRDSSGFSTRPCSCCAPTRSLCRDLPRDLPDAFPECPRGYSSDSSCNSSDGVLVNFSAIYDKMNDGVPEKAGNLNGPAERPPPDDRQDPTSGAFYLDLLTSPAEPPPSAFSACSCSAEHRAGPQLDANCNSYCAPPCGSAGGAVSCLQSQARLVVATQNYYKLVTCDLWSQSSPSPAGSSVHSGSEEQSGASPPSPTRPSEYFLFRQRDNQEVEDEEEDEKTVTPPGNIRTKDDDDEDAEDEEEEALEEPDAPPVLLQGQVYVNASPPPIERDAPEAPAPGRPRSRSYDRHLDKSPARRLGSLERMLSCPVRLSEGGGALAPPPPPPPPRVTSFAEIARSKRRHGGSPSLKADPFSSTEFSPGREGAVAGAPHAACCARDAASEANAEGGPSSCSDVPPAVMRYSKERRPTSLPIQPFTFHHQLASKPPQPKPPQPLLTGYVPGMRVGSGSGSGSGSGGADDDEDAAENEQHRGGLTRCAAPPGPVRPSPLGSYSPPRLQEGAASSGTCSTCSPTPPPELSRRPHRGPPPRTPPPAGLAAKRGAVPPTLPPMHRDTLSPLGCPEAESVADGSKAVRMHNVKQPPQSYGDFLPDYFSVSERPPEEFCLSPDASAASSFSSQLQISVDMTHKRGLVKAVNTAVDLIVAHFGTSRDPDVKAKLGNSWVSPNVGHLILKYLCPALREVLQDGLKAYVLDLIIGQRRCHPWSLAEASAQLGPSTRVLHKLLRKVSQFSELTSHSMRLNAFIFGLLNIKSLEFWLNHLLSHEDIIGAHYNAWGLVPLAQGACRHLFSELLLLLQPLSLLPFDLDLLFEPRLLATGLEQQRRRKELLSSAGQSGARSTLQLMRGWGAAVGDMVSGKERAAPRQGGAWPGTEAPRWESAPMGGDNGSEDRGAGGQRMKGVGRESEETDVGNDPAATDAGRQRQDRQAGWWYQLMRSSQVYIDRSAQGSKFARTDKRRTSAERRPCRPPPAREGVVEGAESGSAGPPSWMGSPPESILNQEAIAGGGPAAEVRLESATRDRGLRWGRLFGAGVGSPAKTDGGEAHKSRLPSGWLGLDSSVLGLMAQTVGAGGGQKEESVAADDPTGAVSPNDTRPSETRLSTCEVRALCHHIATEAGQLSFNKGDVLRVLSKADPDWLLCSVGAARGLVPIVYVSLCGTGESRAGGGGQDGAGRGVGSNDSCGAAGSSSGGYEC